MMFSGLSPYRIVCEPPEAARCAGLDAVCEPGFRHKGRWARFALRAIVLTTLVIGAGAVGAAAHAVLSHPAPPVELGPAAIAKLRRPFPGLMGYGYESHDPYELEKRALELAQSRYDISVLEVRLSDSTASRLRRDRDDLSGLEPVIVDGKLASVRVVGGGTPLGRAIGLLPGDEIRSINGWPVPLIDDQVLHGSKNLAVLEVSRNGSPMVFCVSWR